MPTVVLFTTLLLPLAPEGGPATHRPAAEDLARRAAVIKPTADEVRWRRIPWLTDLARAQEQARQERRPIFLWVTGDDPLERC